MTQKKEMRKELRWDGALALQAGTDPAEKGFTVSRVPGRGTRSPYRVLRDRRQLLSIPRAVPVWLPAAAGLSAPSLEEVHNLTIAQRYFLPPQHSDVASAASSDAVRPVLGLLQRTFPKLHQNPGVLLAGVGIAQQQLPGRQSLTGLMVPHPWPCRQSPVLPWDGDTEPYQAAPALNQALEEQSSQRARADPTVQNHRARSRLPAATFPRAPRWSSSAARGHSKGCDPPRT